MKYLLALIFPILAEATVTLQLQTSTKREGAETMVTARLANSGTQPVRVLTDEFFHLVSTRLVDARGKEIPCTDGRAVRGMAMPPDTAKSVELKPGQGVELMVFDLISVSATAMAGDLSWELQNHSSETLWLDFTYSVSAEAAQQAEKLNAAKVIVGEWKSVPTPVRIAKWTVPEMTMALGTHHIVDLPDLLPRVSEILRTSPDSIAREWAAVSLGQAKYAAGLAVLTASLAKDKVRDVRLACVGALAEIGTKATVAALSAAAKEDSDDLVRKRAEDALKQGVKTSRGN